MRMGLLAGGGALGTLCRYGLSGLVQDRATTAAKAVFPWGTLAVNLIGCFVIGLLWALGEESRFSPRTQLFLFLGLLGGFTTFSSYALESVSLLRGGALLWAAGNVLASNFLGLALTFGGLFLGRWIVSLARGA